MHIQIISMSINLSLQNYVLTILQIPNLSQCICFIQLVNANISTSVPNLLERFQSMLKGRRKNISIYRVASCGYVLENGVDGGEENVS